ncbi:DUF6586 family protein [uncultured Microbulbifer sp.]|uniref:DUF6586 family protein n=1 Tax=uncultured Microbulbifer sp. TaxID=348147 RepID=UPI0025DD2B7C|nr:DUF6586 family protein [uncultured Microbulbifer sp.]
MSNPYTGSVASALRKCQLLLSAAAEGEVAAVPPSHPAALVHAATLEGALLQLWRAYRAFLAEQAHQLSLGAEPESATALLKLAAASHKASAEVGELVSLAENPDSWFRELEQAWRALWRFAAQQGGARASGSVSGPGAVQNLIPSTQLAEAPAGPLSVERLEGWHRKLSELVARQRAQGQEW